MLASITDIISLETLFKLIIACILSLVIGLERELKKKPVGLKTSLVIASFSCLLTVISIETAYSMPGREDINITMDPLRLAAQIVSGIGFLGAGVILRRGNDSISGLTTAALIWGAAAIGIAVGAGFYAEAFIAAVIVLIGIEWLAPFLTRIGPKRLRMKEISLIVQVADIHQLQDVMNYLEKAQLLVEHAHVKDRYDSQLVCRHELHLRLAAPASVKTIELYQQLYELPYIQRVEIELL
ncbi:MgtC/SapB family protein [Caryophanon tenue]|uniref:Protein sapB n=1 Tax=Caryophanon tenue TaxID=33978 RepID=A0A1C0YEF3_9BACL|nr:MgtC/SapB family protein [Caryophanon tenue]OCS85557.1 protein sapB [Caryophanon tenue]